MRKAVEILKKTAEGREALLEIIQFTGVWTSASSNSPVEIAYLNGKRKIGAEVMAHLLTDELNALTLMMSERFIRSQIKKKGDENDDE